MSKNAGKVYAYTKEGAHVVLYPSGEDVKKCEIILKGSSENGSIKIYNTTDPDDKEAGKKTKLTLNGVSLKSQRGPAINYQVGKRLFLHLEDGTENSIEDCSAYKEDVYYFPGKTSAEEDRKGCFFSEKAVVVSGRGKLTVKDESDTKILAVTSPQGSQSAGVILSSSKFVKGVKYTISIGDTVYQTVTLSNKITTIGSQTGPGGGPGRFGPRGPGGR